MPQTIDADDELGLSDYLRIVRRRWAWVLLPLAAAFYSALLILVTVRQGHCRSRAAALLLGLVVAIVLYPGQLWLAMRADTGAPAVITRRRLGSSTSCATP